MSANQILRTKRNKFHQRAYEPRDFGGSSSSFLNRPDFIINDESIDFEKSNSIELSTIVTQLTDEAYINEIIHSSEDLIEKSFDVDFIEVNSDYFRLLNEIYEKIEKSLLISFESFDSCCLLWKIKKIEKFLHLNLNYDFDASEIYSIARRFIKKSLEEDYLGVAQSLIENDRWRQAKLEITQLADSRDYNLLMFAAEVNAVESIELLLKIGFSVNDRVQKETSADIAWKNQNFDVLVILLNNNSCFPNGVDSYTGNGDEFPQGLKENFQISASFYQTLEIGNEADIKDFIQKHRNFRHFYNAWNVSAPKFALFKKNLRLYELFMENNIVFGPFEPIVTVFEDLSDGDREKLAKIHLKHTKDLPEQHINFLVANSNLGHDIDKLDEKRNYVERAYYTLNSIALIQIILKCVAASKKFNIIFDFNRGNVQFLDPTMDSKTDGLFDSSIGRLFIGAKQIFDAKRRNEVLGTIAHELCHYAMFLVYKNNGKPYHKDDRDSRVKFERISRQCERRSKRELLINAVYEYYEDFFWDAELIVRVPHLTALYYDQVEKLDEVRKNYKPLFEYYEKKVYKDMEKALPQIGMREAEKKQKRKKENWILRIVSVLLLILLPTTAYIVYEYVRQPYRDFSWCNITQNERQKIIESDLNFQGQIVKITNLTSDLSVFDLLSADRIKEFLLDDKAINIDKQVSSKKRFFIERHFTERTNDNKTISFMDISNKIANDKYFDAFILADEAGTGKTTTFKNLTQKLKSDFPSKWITHVFLKDHVNAFKEEAIVEPLVDYLGLKVFNLNEFNFTIFKKLFNDNNSIILWDGFDEITPTYEVFVLNLLARIKSETKNIQIISTRTIYTEKIENTLNVNAHKFIPYTVDDRVEFLIEYSEENKFTVREAIKSQSFLERFLKKVEDSDKTRDVNNPLMLEIFLKTAKERFSKSLKDTAINFYSLYDDFIETKHTIFYDKLTEGKSEFLCRKNTDRSHQILALKLIFNDVGIRDIKTNEIRNISSLDIMRNINDTNLNELSKIGIIDVFKNQFTNEIEYNFGHRTFAEFFIAQYLIESFYRIEYVPRDDEMSLRLNLLYNVLSDHKFNIIQQYVIDFVNGNEEISTLDNLPSDVYLNVIQRDIFDHYFLKDESLAFVDRISNFFKVDHKMLNSFWRLHDNETFFIWYFKESSSDTFKEAYEVAARYFPNQNDQEKLFCGENQSGNIIFNIWLQKDERKKLWIDFYSKKLDFQVENLNITQILNTTESDKREILIRNPFKVFYHLLNFQKVHFDFAELNREWIRINETLSVDEMNEFLLGIDWKKNDTILHEIASNGSVEILDNFVDKNDKNFFRKFHLKSLFSWQNRNNHETPFSLASKNREQSFVKQFCEILYENVDSVSVKNVTTLKNLKDKIPLIESLRNEDQNVFGYVKGFYEYYSVNDIEEYFNNGSLKFLLDDSNVHDKNYHLLTEYLERSSNDLRKLFASNDEEFRNIFINFLNTNEVSKSSVLMKLLMKTLNDNESERISTVEDLKIDKMIQKSMTEFNQTSNHSSIHDIKDFFNQNLNYFNDSQVDLYRMLSNDEFVKILTQIALTNGSSSSSDNNLNNHSIYSVFDKYLTDKFLALFVRVYGKVVLEQLQILAVENYLSLDYLRNMLTKSYLNTIASKFDLLKVNGDGTHYFEYKPYQGFFAAQYFVEKLFKSENNDSADLALQFDMLISMWKMRFEDSLNFITNYLENTENSLNPTLKPLIIANYSNLLTDIEVTSIKYVSIFFKQNDEILRKLWKIDETETLYCEFMMAGRLDELDYLDSIANQFFNTLDIEKFKNLDTQKWKILFKVWNNTESTNFDLEKVLSKLYVNRTLFNDRKHSKVKNFVKFFNYVSDLLSLEDQKKLINVDSRKYFFEDLFKVDINDFNTFWHKTSKILSKNEISEIFLQKAFESTSVLHHATKIESVELLKVFLTHLTQVLSTEQYFDLMISRFNQGCIPFTFFIWNKYDSPEIIEAFWNASNKMLNETQQREILLVKSYDEDTALTSALLYLPGKVENFNLIKNLYRKFFNTTEIQDLIANESDGHLENYIFKLVFSSIADYLFELFESEKEKFFVYLSRRKDGLTVFERHKDDQKYQRHLKILTEYVKKNYKVEELKLIGIE